MDNSAFDNFISQLYQNSSGAHNPLTGSARNKAIEDLIKSLTDDVDKYWEELEKDKFTEEEFEKACEDLGLEDSGEETDDVDDFFQRLQV